MYSPTGSQYHAMASVTFPKKIFILNTFTRIVIAHRQIESLIMIIAL